MDNGIYNIACEDGLKQIPNSSIDFVCIDPPYTDGKNDVLAGHKIHGGKIDIDEITKQHYRVLKDDTFYAVFGQMPSILAWHNAAIAAGFKFRIDIVWCKKRTALGGNQRLKKTHELVWIYSKGSPNYYTFEGNYTDVSQGMVEHDLMDIKTIFSKLSKYEAFVKDGKERFKKDGNPKNDSFFADKGNIYNRSKCKGTSEIKTEKRFNSVWAFASHNVQKFGKDEYNVKHPTVKSIPVVERLIELCTPRDPNITVLDSFLGSGTTYLACLNTGRLCIGFERENEYYQIAQTRAEANKNPIPCQA